MMLCLCIILNDVVFMNELSTKIAPSMFHPPFQGPSMSLFKSQVKNKLLPLESETKYFNRSATEALNR